MKAEISSAVLYSSMAELLLVINKPIKSFVFLTLEKFKLGLQISKPIPFGKITMAKTSYQ